MFEGFRNLTIFQIIPGPLLPVCRGNQSGFSAEKNLLSIYFFERIFLVADPLFLFKWSYNSSNEDKVNYNLK